MNIEIVFDIDSEEMVALVHQALSDVGDLQEWCEGCGEYHKSLTAVSPNMVNEAVSTALRMQGQAAVEFALRNMDERKQAFVAGLIAKGLQQQSESKIQGSLQRDDSVRGTKKKKREKCPHCGNCGMCGECNEWSCQCEHSKEGLVCPYCGGCTEADECKICPNCEDWYCQCMCQLCYSCGEDLCSECGDCRNSDCDACECSCEVEEDAGW